MAYRVEHQTPIHRDSQFTLTRKDTMLTINNQTFITNLNVYTEDSMLSTNKQIAGLTAKKIMLPNVIRKKKSTINQQLYKKAGRLCEQLRLVGPLDELKTASTTEPQLHNVTS